MSWEKGRETAHLAWRAAHWEDVLAKARAAGRQMAEKALAAGGREN